MDNMEEAVTAITGAITPAGLWGVFAKVMPLVGIVTLASLGFYLIRRQIKKVSKFKGGM